MAYRSTYTHHTKLLKKYPKLLELSPNYELPRRRTDRRYRRRCSRCCCFLAIEVKGCYCRKCNAERRRRDRQELAYERGQRSQAEQLASRWGMSPGDLVLHLLREIGG